ncbi:MAG TPA: Mth938-like domain-containing protein [Steroidobacteraceae bacterium]|jgi:uncharacterized protein|nr:Mth938-like domain-containing protein [Steroidobacteraceae bacterium]
MRLALESDPSIHLVRSYGEGVITVGAQELRGPCVIAPHGLLTEWSATSVDELTEPQFAMLLTMPANIVLLGTDAAAQWPPAAIRAWCHSKGIALETMNLGAACRTYNILASEQRAVVAGLFP